MSHNIKLSNEAIQDYDEAVAWYEGQQKGLGFDFSYRLSETLEQIENFPASFQLLHQNRRCAVLKQFPYKVFYVFKETQPDVLVFAILHDKQHPDLWQRRRV
jgi:toxin ParE1/3/4